MHNPKCITMKETQAILRFYYIFRIKNSIGIFYDYDILCKRRPCIYNTMLKVTLTIVRYSMAKICCSKIKTQHLLLKLMSGIITLFYECSS